MSATDVYATALEGVARSAYARHLVALADRLDRKAKRMAEVCANPPCQHAQGIELAAGDVRAEAQRVIAGSGQVAT